MTVSTFINDDIGYRLGQVDTNVISNGSAYQARPGVTTSGDNLGEFVYVVAGADFATPVAVVDGTAIAFDGAFVASRAAGTTPKVGQFVGVARLNDTVAQGNGFWVQICGQAPIRVAASAAANTFLSTSTTAGVLASAAGAGTTMKLQGITLNAANGGSVAAVEGTLNYPMVGAAN